MSGNLIENRTIRVFISSTFSDMGDERTELMKRTFPRLRAMAAKRDVTLTEVDLRWGITKDESESGKVVDICLREIQNSIPFFIGIIGNRYGWIPSGGDIEESTYDRFVQVRSYVERKLSVTDMEMQFGVLEHKDDLHAYFYINDNKKERDNNPEKLAKLKRAVRSNGRYPVSDFSSPEDLAKQVEEAFVRLLDELFPDNHFLSFLEKERISQRSFLNQLSQSYVQVKEYFEKLDSFLADENQQYLIVTGESGLGKSALVANWVKGLIDKKQTNRKIIYHFIGNGGSLGSHNHVVKTLCAELKDQFKLEAPSDEREKEKWEKDESDTLEMVYSRISVDKEGCLIVLDAVNQLVNVDNAKNMLWLGFPPRNVKVLITTFGEDATMNVFKRRGNQVVELIPLGHEQRRELVKDYLKTLYGKCLTAEQVTKIIDDRQSSNTLVLRTLLDELVSSGTFADLEKRIQYYLDPDSIPDFYQRVLERYEDDYGRDNVSHVLSLILLSRDGLPEDAITEIPKLIPLHWSQLYCSLISHLNVRKGLVQFSHKYFSEAVQQRYIIDNSDYEKRLREEIVGHFKQKGTEFSWSELGYQYEKLEDNQSLYTLLMREDTFLYFYDNEVNNLTRWWNRLLADSSDQYRIEHYLNLIASTSTKNLDFIMDLSCFTRTRCVNPSLCLKFAELGKGYAENQVQGAFVLSNIGCSYSLQGDFVKAIEYHEKALELRLSVFGKKHLDVASSYNNLGVVYGCLGYRRRALKYLEKAIKIRMSVLGNNHPDVAESYINYGSELGKVGTSTRRSVLFHKKRVLACFEEALRIKMSVFGEYHPEVAIVYRAIGRECGNLGNQLSALGYYEKALKIWLPVFGENHPDVATLYMEIGHVYRTNNDHRAALEYEIRALRIRLSVYGEDHLEVVDSYNDVAYEYQELGNDKKALEYYEKALKIRLLVFDIIPQHVAKLYSDFGSKCVALGDDKKALEYYGRALNIRLSVLGENHLDVAKSYDDIGLLYETLGDDKKALEYYGSALNIRLSVLGENHLDVASSYEDIGSLYETLGDDKKALEYYEISLKIRLSLFNHPLRGDRYEDIAISYSDVGRTYKKLGQIDKANDYYRRSAKRWKRMGNKEKMRDCLLEIVVNK